MSERGSFVTEYIYCERDFTVLKEALEKRIDWSQSGRGVHVIGNPPSILAGMTGGNYANHEVYEFESEILHGGLDLCHTIRVAVLPDDGGIYCYNLQPKHDGGG